MPEQMANEGSQWILFLVLCGAGYYYYITYGALPVCTCSYEGGDTYTTPGFLLSSMKDSDTQLDTGCKQQVSPTYQINCTFSGGDQFSWCKSNCGPQVCVCGMQSPRYATKLTTATTSNGDTTTGCCNSLPIQGQCNGMWLAALFTINPAPPPLYENSVPHAGAQMPVRGGIIDRFS